MTCFRDFSPAKPAAAREMSVFAENALEHCQRDMAEGWLGPGYKLVRPI
jgi:hypothetical protein